MIFSFSSSRCSQKYQISIVLILKICSVKSVQETERLRLNTSFLYAFETLLVKRYRRSNGFIIIMFLNIYVKLSDNELKGFIYYF